VIYGLHAQRHPKVNSERMVVAVGREGRKLKEKANDEPWGDDVTQHGLPDSVPPSQGRVEAEGSGCPHVDA